MSGEKLKPCPFCRAMMEQHPTYPNEWRHAYRRGVRCPAGSHVVYINQPADVEEWNRRAVPDDVREAAERLLNAAEKFEAAFVGEPAPIFELPPDVSTGDIINLACHILGVKHD